MKGTIASRSRTRLTAGSRLSSRVKKVLAGITGLTALLLLAGFAFWSRAPLDLGKSDNVLTSGLYPHWLAGDLIVLVRHGERCDRSKNPCLGPDDGITQKGSEVATDVGKAFRTLGLGNSDILASPTVRTAQTALYMFGIVSSTQRWLYDCDKTMLKDALALKAAHRNLILVTHSNCISKFEGELNYEHAPTSGYSSAVFVAVEPHAKPKVLGLMNPQDWQPALAKTLKIADSAVETLNIKDPAVLGDH